MKNLIAVFTAILLFISCENKNRMNSIAEVTIKEPDNKSISPEINSDTENAGFLTDTTGLPQITKPEKKNQMTPTVPASNPDWDKKIIKTASLNIEVKDYSKYNTSLRDKVRQLGGYVSQEEQNQSDYKIENILTLKVPVDQFDNAINLLSAEVEKVNEKKITSQDVTAEMVDSRSRLEAKKQVRLRYLDLLKQAKNMEEILNVQSEINDIQEEIEAASGRINYLSHSSSYSAIQLTYFQVLNAKARNTDQPAFGAKLSNAFRTGWNWVGELFVGIVFIWPLILMIFTGIIIYKKIRSPKTKPVKS